MKKNIWTFLILLTWLPIWTSAQTRSISGETKKYEIAQLQFDFKILKEALIKIHPGLFWYQTESQFEERCKHVYNEIKSPMTETDFYKLVRPLVGDVKCGHTTIWFSKPTLSYYADSIKFVPINVEIMNHKVYLTKEYSGNKNVALGAEITAINGKKMESVLKDMEIFSIKDGENMQAAEYRQKWMFPFAFVLLYGDTATYQIDFMETSGRKSTIILNGMTDKAADKLRMAEMKKSPPLSPFRYKQIDSLSTAILTIDQFQGKKISKFLKTSYGHLERANIENLVIDVRRNGGGDDEFGALLYSYIAKEQFNYYDHLEITIDNPTDTIFKYGELEPFIAKGFKRHQFQDKNNGFLDLEPSLHPNLKNAPFQPKKNGFQKNVYILIGEECFSATTEFCAIVHANKRATFIGRETGGCYCGNTSYSMFNLTLPNSGLRAFIPLVRYYMAVKTCPFGRGIQPDYPVEKSILNMVNNKDAELDFTLNLIKASRAK